MFSDQTPFRVRLEWGVQALQTIAVDAQVVILVDVLSFSTCVDVAVARGAIILPHPHKGASAVDHARRRSALLAGRRGEAGYSLSPASLESIPPSTRLVLPSPNGSTLTRMARAPVVAVGCLRNARAVAQFADAQNGPVAIVPCGERWKDGSLRAAIEDLIGAGSIAAHLRGPISPEARTAIASFRSAETNLCDTLMTCASGRELAERSFACDVEIASRVDVSRAVPTYDPGSLEIRGAEST